MTAAVVAAPTRTAGARYVGAVIALLLVALGALLVRDAAVAFGWLRGSSWSSTALDWAAAPKPASAFTATGAVAALLGIACVFAALKPRRKRAAALTADTAVFVDYTDIARIASAAAQSVPGVIDARSSAGARSVTVRCTVTGERDDALRRRIAVAVDSQLAALQRTPRINIKVRAEDNR